jgi:hypothetical protein
LQHLNADDLIYFLHLVWRLPLKAKKKKFQWKINSDKIKFPFNWQSYLFLTGKKHLLPTIYNLLNWINIYLSLIWGNRRGRDRMVDELILPMWRSTGNTMVTRKRTNWQTRESDGDDSFNLYCGEFLLFYCNDGKRIDRDIFITSYQGLARLVSWCLTPLSTIYRSVLLVEKTRVLGRKPLTCRRKSLTNFIT